MLQLNQKIAGEAATGHFFRGKPSPGHGGIKYNNK
jgi:hypothetical protein